MAGEPESTSSDPLTGALAADDPKDPDGPKDPKDPKDPDDPKEHHPGFGWPWWEPCPHDPDDPGGPGGPGLPPGSGGGGGGVTHSEPPSGRPSAPPAMQLPAPGVVPRELPNISVDPTVDAVTGLAEPELPFVPIGMPAIVAPRFSPGPGTPSVPESSGSSQDSQPPSRVGQQNPPAFGASNGVPPESFRAGYGNYLRTAGVGEMMVVAIPGVAGILALTSAGGLLGYRQARAGHAVRANGTARFVG